MFVNGIVGCNKLFCLLPKSEGEDRHALVVRESSSIFSFRALNLKSGEQYDMRANEVVQKLLVNKLRFSDCFAVDLLTSPNVLNSVFLIFFFVTQDNSLQYCCAKVILEPDFTITLESFKIEKSAVAIPEADIDRKLLARDDEGNLYMGVYGKKPGGIRILFKITLQEVENWFSGIFYKRFFNSKNNSTKIVMQCFHTIKLPMSPEVLRENSWLPRPETNSEEETTFQDATWTSMPCVLIREKRVIIIFYASVARKKNNTNIKIGQFWSYDCCGAQKEWKKLFEIEEHAISNKISQKYCATDGLIYIHGNCFSCDEKAHVHQISLQEHYRPSDRFHGRIPTVSQELAIFHGTKEHTVHVIYGPTGTGKTFAAFHRVRTILERNGITSITLYYSNASQINNMEGFGVAVQTKFLNELPDDVRNSDFPAENSVTVIDETHYIPYPVRDLMLRCATERKQLVVVVNGKLEAQERCELFSFFFLPFLTVNPIESSSSNIVVVEPKNKFEEWLNVSMDAFYSRTINGDWNDTFFSKEPMHPMCVPPCLNPQYNEESEENKTGRKAEEFFLKLLRSTKIGGFAIFNLHSEKIKLILKRKLSNSIEWPKKGFEIDCLLLHPVLGIIAIEVKGKLGIAEDFRRCTELMSYFEQLKKISDLLPFIFKLITEQDLAEAQIPFHLVACLPNVEGKGFQVSGLKIYCKEELSSPEVFADSLYSNCEHKRDASAILQPFHENELKKEWYARFMATMVGCRSTYSMTKKQSRNAIEILNLNKHLQTSSVSDGQTISYGSKRYLPNGETTEIWLKPDQLIIAECTAPYQLIVGPPSTGKTLLIMLKMFNVAKLAKKNDRIFVFAKSAALRKKFRSDISNIIKMEPNYLKIVPKVMEEIIESDIENKDHVFIDEETLDDDVFAFLKFRMHEKSKTTGQTVIAITGGEYPTQAKTVRDHLNGKRINHFLFLYDPNDVPKYEVEKDICLDVSKPAKLLAFELTAVLRNSESIANYWLRSYEMQNAKVGHNLIGEDVVEKHCTTSDEVKDKLYEELHEDLSNIMYMCKNDDHTPRNNNETRLLQPCDIAILAQDDNLLQLIKNCLDKKFVSYGTIEQQLDNPRLIAVDIYQNSLSFEWPIVYGVGVVTSKSDRAYGIVTISRAIAKFVNIFKIKT